MNSSTVAKVTSTSERLSFQRKARLSVWQSLVVRALVVLTLVGVAVGGHWLDRTGLRDNVDGEISLLDVVYFTAITITTVGYGDIHSDFHLVDLFGHRIYFCSAAPMGAI